MRTAPGSGQSGSYSHLGELLLEESTELLFLSQPLLLLPSTPHFFSFIASRGLSLQLLNFLIGAYPSVYLFHIGFGLKPSLGTSYSTQFVGEVVNPYLTQKGLGQGKERNKQSNNASTTRPR